MKRYLIYLALCGSLLPLSACNDFLDTTPDNRTEIDSPDKFQSLIASAYPKSSYAALLNPRCDFVSDIGDGYSLTVNSASFFWRDVDATSQDTPSFIWQKTYHSVASVNYALDASRVMDQEQIKPYIAEAKVVRAFSHFILVNLFAKMYEPGAANSSPGIPYVTEPETEVIKQYERGTVALTYDMIEQDLVEGIAGLGLNNVYQVPAYHFTRDAAHAFASRFYLYKGDWNRVIEHANQVLPVPSNFINVTYGNLKDGNGTTVIESNTMLSRNIAANDKANVDASKRFQPWRTTFAVTTGGTDAIAQEYSSADNPSNLLICETLSWFSRYVNQWRYATAHADTEATVNATNVSSGAWCYRIYRDNATQRHWYVPKMNRLFVTSSIDATTGQDWVPFTFLRYEEVLLNRAEALAMSGRVDEAIDDLNIFCRQRIWGSTSKTSYLELDYVVNKQKLINFYHTAVTDANHYMNKYKAYGSDSWPLLKKCLIQCILDFRRNEFMWEGLRYWDLLRYKIPVTHYTFDGRSNTLYPGDDRWVIQMPETVTLSGIELNPRTNLLSPKW